jgi:hypothetical protein
MIRSNVLKWAALGAIALVSIPAMGLARHASHVSAPSLKAVTSVTAASSNTARPDKLVSHKAKAKAAVKGKKHKKAKRHVAKKHAAKHKKHKAKK